MRRPMVIALAFLTVSLTGGSCEFRAVSNNSIPNDPPEGEPSPPPTGVVIVGNVGGSSATTSNVPLDRSTIQSALAASVLSAPLVAMPSTDAAMPDPGPGRLREFSAAHPESLRVENPIPEPGGFWLYGVGLMFLAGTLRRSHQSDSKNNGVGLRA